MTRKWKSCSDGNANEKKCLCMPRKLHADAIAHGKIAVTGTFRIEAWNECALT